MINLSDKDRRWILVTGLVFSPGIGFGIFCLFYFDIFPDILLGVIVGLSASLLSLGYFIYQFSKTGTGIGWENNSITLYRRKNRCMGSFPPENITLDIKKGIGIKILKIYNGNQFQFKIEFKNPEKAKQLAVLIERWKKVKSQAK